MTKKKSKKHYVVASIHNHKDYDYTIISFYHFKNGFCKTIDEASKFSYDAATTIVKGCNDYLKSNPYVHMDEESRLYVVVEVE